MGLTLTRYVGESIRIGEDIVVTVREVQRQTGDNPRVCLSIEAPKWMRIVRDEIVLVGAEAVTDGTDRR